MQAISNGAGGAPELADGAESVESISAQLVEALFRAELASLLCQFLLSRVPE